MPEYRNLIIVGANKCGTTSLFRYLSSHPLVCASSRKEVHFFDQKLNLDNTELAREYVANFPDRTSVQEVLLEATPNYLDGGHVIAEKIRYLLDDPLIIIMLRNPVDRVVSYYKSKQGWIDSAVHGMKFSDFVDQALKFRSMDPFELDPVSSELRLQITKSEYVAPLREFYSTFAAKNLLVIFLESLRASPRECLDTVCDFAGLSSKVYQKYDFRVENRSRYHRSAIFRTFSSKTNLILEPLLNRFPRLRQTLGRVYNLINVSQGKSHVIDAESITRLKNHFSPYNRQLRDFLETNMHSNEMPDWLIE